jgi:hypothetical protein
MICTPNHADRFQKTKEEKETDPNNPLPIVRLSSPLPPPPPLTKEARAEFRGGARVPRICPAQLFLRFCCGGAVDLRRVGVDGS